jgi:D-lactate dehydrogenase
MKTGLMIINTSRGGLVDTQSLITNLKSGQIGNLALDVYEQESELFFEDHSSSIIQDDVLQRLLSFPNVIITGHQGFFTAEALEQIAVTTINNFNLFAEGKLNNNDLK